MTLDLSRLFQPRSIAVIGGGAWCAQVVAQAVKFGFDGDIWRVNPKGGDGIYVTLTDLPRPPDAAFVGINRHATIDAVAVLSGMGAGGAICFASGFSESAAEDAQGGDLQAAMRAAAGEMPILGPNCYGFVNALDGALLWPDQQGCTRVERGVAILTQSSNIAINLTMQQRALPIAYMVTCGNMAQTSQAQIASALLNDPRVTAIGFHIEGFGDLREWEVLAQKAAARGIPLVAIKVGTSQHAQQATISHTASLAGSDAGAQALLDRLGIARLRDLPSFLETLKLLHCYGSLPDGKIASISCSGGEASLVADMAEATALSFPALTNGQEMALRTALGPMVALSNPLDYHTYIWRDQAAMAQAWSGMTGRGISMTLSVVDYPTTDASDWTCATQAAVQVRAQTGAGFGVVATLPELMPLDVAQDLMAGGVVPFFGLAEALLALQAATEIAAPNPDPIVLPGTAIATQTLTEHTAKAALAAHSLRVPRNCVLDGDAGMDILYDLHGPFAVKGLGLAHKSDQGAVRLGVLATEVPKVAGEIGTGTVLVEEMVQGSLAELLIGVVRDPAHGFVLTLGAGGILTEMLQDAVSLLLPVRPADVEVALDRLKCAPMLRGYRGNPPVAKKAILDAVMAVQAYVLVNASHVSEVEINPLICTADDAIAVDALIRKA